MIDLLRACRSTGTADKWPSVAELRTVLRAPSLDPADACVWLDIAGSLAAFALLAPEWLSFHFFAHPDSPLVRSQVVGWAESRAHWIVTARGTPSRLRTRPREDSVETIALLQAHGFTRDDGLDTLRMARDLTAPIPPPDLPSGFSIRPIAGESEVHDYIALHRDAFGTAHATVEDRRAFMQDPSYRADLDLVVVAPDGALAAFCVGSVDSEENRLMGMSEGWTDPVGTRPAYRRQGLGRAAVLDACRRLQAMGIETAILGTGAWNTPARHTFESAGFSVLYRLAAYSKAIG